MTILTQRNLAKGFGPILLLTAALSLPSGAGAQSSPYRSYGYGPQGTLDGFITAQSGRCPTLREHQTNRVFSLVGDTHGLRPGDHVRLRERAVRSNACSNQGPVLEVLEIRTVWAGSQHRTAYFDSNRDGDFARFIVRSRNRGGWYSDRYAYQQKWDDHYGQYGGNGDRYDRNRPYDDRSDDRYDRNDRNDSYDNRDDRDGRSDDSYDRNGDDQRLVTVDGTLNYRGECPAVRSGGTSYDLAGDLGNYHDGDRVHVTGFAAGQSSCGGTALQVQEIRRR